MSKQVRQKKEGNISYRPLSGTHVEDAGFGVWWVEPCDFTYMSHSHLVLKLGSRKSPLMGIFEHQVR